MRPDNIFLSIIIPVLNEEDNIQILIEKVTDSIKHFSNYEIIFIDDGSYDDSLKRIKEARESNTKIKYISFSRNFGHQNALRAGINIAKGNIVISMDADMQHPPELIPKLIEKWHEGYDIVYTIRTEKQKGLSFKNLTSKCFYRLINKLSDTKIEQGSADFRLLDRCVVDYINKMQESDIFLRSIIKWVGFKNISINYCPEKRKFGKTKYSFIRMSGLAISGITSFSLKPLRISTFIGFIIAFLSVIYGLYAIYVRLFVDDLVKGWSSLLFMISFIGGIQLMMIGILGEYIGRIFLESKNRPNYIIKESDLK